MAAAMGAAAAAYYDPAASAGRQARIEPARAALLFIDTQNFNCHREGAIYRGAAPGANDEWWGAVAGAVPKWQRLRRAAREAGIEVIYTVIQSLTADGRDRSLDYKLSGFHVPPGCWDAQVIDELKPGLDELVLPKTTSSVFSSTTLHYLLRNMGRDAHLLVAGCVTDQCVAHAVKDAADLGYRVTMVTDCCIAPTAARHAAALSMVAGYCRQRALGEVEAELAGGGGGGGVRAAV
ncbi:isochorismatase [Raphidocelis subcapitata]|uniref:Isochorismatase n=1 Tax=Raphidocelis subcapitata TaxID=307507 RepID=A0A2V0PCE2_9CHLO|nr:isochorismatase [Raphidocelis subcapitata]|eukprot:GBF97518.1 isochorismatase [Raphidocelis subcapitata]